MSRSGRVPTSPLYNIDSEVSVTTLAQRLQNWREELLPVNPASGVMVKGDPEPGTPCGPRGLPASYFTGTRKPMPRLHIQGLTRQRRTVHHIPDESKIRAIRLRSEGMSYAEIGRTIPGVSERQARLIYENSQKQKK
tara:strand:- start:2484 stop:2894 length:411 start_codon:yes stop_codon:yes gene_type:complete